MGNTYYARQYLMLNNTYLPRYTVYLPEAQLEELPNGYASTSFTRAKLRILARLPDVSHCLGE